MVKHDFEMINLKAGEIVIGSTKGGWMHAGERPAHRVELTKFSISSQKIALEEMPEKGRPPTQAEWAYARSQGVIPQLKSQEVVVLADNAINGHRGAPLDGRPRLSGEAMLKNRYWAMVGQKDGEARVPIRIEEMQNPQTYVVFRSLANDRSEIVPIDTDVLPNMFTEILCIFIFGVIPSFMIPIFRGFADYAIEGWVNLLFGGLCAGFVSGIIWRPRRPIWGIENGKFTRLRS